MMRWTTVLALIVIILALVVWSVAAGLDSTLKTAIERSAEQRLGVAVAIETLEAGVLAERFTVSGLRIANPEGFEHAHFLRLDHGQIQVRIRSLLQDTAQVPMIEVEGIDLVLERAADGRINYREIMEHLRDPAPREDPGTRLQVDRLLIKNVDITFSGIPVVQDRELHFDQIEITDLHDDMSSGDIVGLVVQEILEEVARQGVGLPGDLRESLQETLGGLRELLSAR